MFEGDAGLEVLPGIRQGLELLVRGHHLVVAVAFSYPAPGIDFLGREEAGTMEVEVGREHRLGEAVDLPGEATGDVGVAEVLAHHRAVLGLDQGVVVGFSSPGLGERLDVEFFEQGGDPVVDVLRAIVGVEALDGKGEGLDEGLEHRQQEALGDAFDRAYELELGDLVDEIDVVEALDAVEVALMDRVDAQEAGTAVGMGFAALADGDLDRLGLVDGAALAPVSSRAPEVVEMAVGDAGQALEAGIAEHRVGPLTELAGGRSREGAVEGIDLGQEADVGIGITARERADGSATPIPDRAGIAELTDQAGHLGPGEAADLLQVAPHQALVGLAEAEIAETPQLTGDPVVEGLTAWHVEVEGVCTFKEGVDLLHALEPLGLECHDHPPMIPNPDPLQAHFTLESRLPFRLMSRWKRLPLYNTKLT